MRHARHAPASDSLRLEGRRQQAAQHLGPDPVVDEKAPLYDAAHDRQRTHAQLSPTRGKRRTRQKSKTSNPFGLDIRLRLAPVAVCYSVGRLGPERGDPGLARESVALKASS